MSTEITTKERIVADVVGTLKQVKQSLGYRQDVRAVEREFRTPKDGETPILFVNVSREDRKDLLADVAMSTLGLTVSGLVAQGNQDVFTPNQGTAARIDKLVADVREALVRDTTRGGWSLSTRIRSIDTDTRIMPPWGGFLMQVEARYPDSVAVPQVIFPEVRYSDPTLDRYLRVLDRLRTLIKQKVGVDDPSVNVTIWHEKPRPEELYSAWLPAVFIHGLTADEAYRYLPSQKAKKVLRIPLYGFVLEQNKPNLVRALDDLKALVKTRLALYCDTTPPLGTIQLLDILKISDTDSDYPVGRFEMTLEVSYYDDITTA